MFCHDYTLKVYITIFSDKKCSHERLCTSYIIQGMFFLSHEKFDIPTFNPVVFNYVFTGVYLEIQIDHGCYQFLRMLVGENQYEEL